MSDCAPALVVISAELGKSSDLKHSSTKRQRTRGAYWPHSTQYVIRP